MNYAKQCRTQYPTIVNNIPKEKNSYSNTMDDYAMLDNKLAASQLDIGESSNLAQIIQTYARNFDDMNYNEYISILSVLAQCAIDNAKRRFDVDISGEIKRIKKEVNVKERGYPKFWLSIHRDFNKNNINYDLRCPMNYLYDLKIPDARYKSPTLPFSYFFKKYPSEYNIPKSKRIEALIVKYSLSVVTLNRSTEVRDQEEDYLLLRRDFDMMMSSLRTMTLGKNNIGLMSWLLDRAFLITPIVAGSRHRMKTHIQKSKAALLKTLYELNRESLLKCLSANLE